MKHAFSLVELSIVLVILGLLTGGILTGQNLIRAAELRSVSTEFQTYQTAAHTFRGKYFHLPGDMPNATDFWGAATCPGTAGTGTDTCNGDGDSLIEDPAAGDNFGERFTFFQHLANAGLIEGSYTGMSASTDEDHSIINENIPASKFSNAGWSMIGSASGTIGVSSVYFIDGTYGNFFSFGAAKANSYTADPILTPEEAWNIDTKIDDGQPGSGKAVSREQHTDCYLLADGSAGSTSASVTRKDVKYNLSDISTACILIFKEVF